MEVVAAGEGGNEVAALLALGMYSDTNVLAAMYEAEMAYWRWEQLVQLQESVDGVSHGGADEAEHWRQRSLRQCDRYVRAVEQMAHGGWDTTRAKQLTTLLLDATAPRQRTNDDA